MPLGSCVWVSVATDVCQKGQGCNLGRIGMCSRRTAYWLRYLNEEWIRSRIDVLTAVVVSGGIGGGGRNGFVVDQEQLVELTHRRELQLTEGTANSFPEFTFGAHLSPHRLE